MVDKPYKQSALRVAVKTEPVDVAEMNSEYEASPAADFLASLATFDHSYYCASGIYPSYSVTANSSFTAFSSIESQPTAAPLESLPAATSNESQPATAVNPVANENSIVCDNYEYPREYFIALIDDAQIRYDHALEFFQGMRTYSSKCEVYVTILQDIFVELGKPPATLEPEVYRRLAKLRRCIRHLELKLSSRRPRVVNHPASSLDNVAVKAELCDKATQTDGSYEDSQAKRKALEEFHSQQLPWYELKAKENLEQKIHDLAMKEKRLRDERRGVESELRLQFGSWSGPSEYSAVPPQDITIVNVKGEAVVTSMLNPVLEDQTLELMCTAHGGRPAPRVLWWQNEILIDNQSDIILNNQVKNILRLERVQRHQHGSVLKCEAVNGGNRNSISKDVVVNLYLKPLAVRLLSDHQIFSVGQEYKIICETYGSRPPANITWWLKGTKMHSSLANTVISPDKNHTSSVLRYEPKYQHHGSKLTCKVTNNAIEKSSILDSWNLHIQYAPIVKVELGRNLQKTTIKEGVDVYFDCIINANPPTKKIYWTHNGGILAPGSSRILINQTLVLQKITKQSNGNYCCIAANAEGESQSEPFYLNVQYEPACSANQQLVYGAIKHEKIEVVCNVDANPTVTAFVWKFNNSRIQTKDLQSFITSKTFSVATYQPKNELDYGTLLCWGKNDLGTQFVPCVFHVIPAGKPDTPHNCTVSSNRTTERSVQVSCASGFDGGLPQEFVCEVLTNGSSQLKWNITNRRVPEFVINGLERDLDYTVFIYSSNGKGRSVNRVELQIQSVAETSERHTRIIGIKNSFLFSLWTLALCTILLVLLGFLLILVISIARIRKRHRREKHKKSTTAVGDVTPIHSDDDKNPDVIPQIEENHVLSRQTSSSSHLHLQPCTAEFTAYNTFPKPSLHIFNYANVPVDTDLARCDSVVQWVQPRFTSRNNSRILISTVPSERSPQLIQHTCTQTPVPPHKESAV